jgi:hypothetical protein
MSHNYGDKVMPVSHFVMATAQHPEIPDKTYLCLVVHGQDNVATMPMVMSQEQTDDLMMLLMEQRIRIWGRPNG